MWGQAAMASSIRDRIYRLPDQKITLTPLPAQSCTPHFLVLPVEFATLEWVHWFNHRTLSGIAATVGRCAHSERLDFLCLHRECGGVAIEVKNVRPWLYPRQDEVVDLI